MAAPSSPISVRENGSRYEYEIGEDTYAIPKSSVDRIDAGGMPAHERRTANVRRSPNFHPGQQPRQ